MKEHYDFNSIPSELKSLPQWILWRSEERNGKPTKVPYQANGEMAQANNRRTWSTFATAVKFYLEGDYDGIGFVFSRQDNYIGIDLDKCVVDGKPNAFATEIIDTLDSYTEFSPSEKGLHIIIRGNLPQSVLGTGRKNTKHGLEIYSYGRFFTFTGNRENSNKIYERTDELAEVFEQYFDDSDIQGRVNLAEFEKDEIKLSNESLWEKMFRSKNGDEIKALYNGNLINEDPSASDLSLCNHLAFWTGKSATRMDAMFRETGLARDKWDVIHFRDTNETYGERTIATAISSTTTTVLDHKHEEEYAEFNFDFHSDAVAADEVEKAKKKFRLNELGNAERIAYEYGHVIRYVSGSDHWYIWDGKRWHIDSKKQIERIANKVLRELEKSDDEMESKWARSCGKRNIRMNSIKDLMPLVPAEREEFDRHKFLFNVENGIINLKDAKLQQHDRDFKLSKITNVIFDEKAECPTWINFLNQIFKNDAELIDYMQRLVGYSLTGDISEQGMYFLVGGGSNGKSTFINIIKNLMGDYGAQTNSNTFIKKKSDGANNDIARLANARFVSAVESEEGEKLQESLVKTITGGEPILARFLRQEFFEFIPEFKVFFTTNHKPIIGGVDEGIWRRVKIIPFTLNLKPHERDKKLEEKLSLEMSGILNWALEGCIEWQQSGIKEPKVVMDATGNYKAEMDILAPFLDEMCYTDEPKNEAIRIEAKELYNVYDRWCSQSGERQIGNRSFYRMLETKGFGKTKGAGNKTFLTGITLNERKPVTKGVTENAKTGGFKLSY
ncbi:phage/plasmid primase, P4 family [Lysinibacillus sp. NPDC096418]|uniref:phage/plasmid primase, P4 family n=1 Tax=Lysinibacillus sp. NPDC096418 TaxID=3364138 RepID=UPI0037FE7487